MTAGPPCASPTPCLPPSLLPSPSPPPAQAGCARHRHPPAGALRGAVRRGGAGTPLPRRGPAPAEPRRQSLQRRRRCPCSAGQAGRAAGSVHAWCVDESQQAAAGGGGGRGRRLGGAALGSTLFSILMRAERGLWIFTLRREPPPFIHPHGPRARPLLPPGPAFAPLPSPPPRLFPPPPRLIRPAGERRGAAPFDRAGHAAPGPREKEEEGRWWRRPLAGECRCRARVADRKPVVRRRRPPGAGCELREAARRRGAGGRLGGGGDGSWWGRCEWPGR